VGLTQGQRLGPFTIAAAIGAGGMGEVYRATDTTLERDVAIKVLPAEVAQDPERLARFEREAKLLASLNHPNVAHVYGFESATAEGGAPLHFLAMELVPGEDLAERLKRGPIPVDEALEIARQIAEGLEAAHEKGIVHRDLKPANVKLTADGKVKVLDFGLAKAYAGEAAGGSASDLSQSPTLANTGTQAGVILGTAAYMSPEQARGRAVDKRADVWAFGVLLFEMLTARHPFGGESVSELLAAVMKDEPAWGALPAGIPPAVTGVLHRCLVKDPAHRLHDVADARILLEDAGREPETASPMPSPRPRRREALAWLLALGGIGAAAALAWRRPASVPDAPLTQFSIALPADQPIASVDTPTLALSPDGRKLAFVVSGTSGQTSIRLRTFDRPGTRPLPGTDGGTSPFFSPDGGSLGFFSEGRLKTLSLAGGAVVTVAEAPTSRGGVWASDGSILFSPEYAAGLWRVPASGGAAEALLSPDAEKGERTYRWPDLIPGGRAVLYTLGSLDSPNDYDQARIVACSLATGEKRVVVEGGSMARFVPPDRLFYIRGGVLFVATFDPVRLEVVGQPTAVVEGVAGDASSGASYFTLARDGTLAVVRGTSQSGRRLVLVDRQKGAATLPLSARGFRHPRFSPDGTRLAFTVGVTASGVGADADVWVYGLASGTLSRLTFDGRAFPVWSPDGRRIAYLDPKRSMILVKSADGAGAEETIAPRAADAVVVGDWSPNGHTLALTRLGSVNEILLVEPGGKPRLFETDASAPAFSPDGRWIAYNSPAVGATYVFVRAVSGEGKWQVSSELGAYPRWSRDGRELFYIGISDPRVSRQLRPLMAVPVEKGESFRAGPPRVVVEDLSRYLTVTAPQVDWDVAPDGRRFVFLMPERAGDEGTRIDVALHWARHLAGGERTAGD
jgi:serine/threonine protein kinase